MNAALACARETNSKSMIVGHRDVLRSARFGACWSALVLGMSSVAQAIVITDDFSDLNDTANPAWVHLDKTVGSTGQTWDASSGAYRLTAPPNGVVELAPQFNDLAFVGSYVPQSFSDVRVAADFVHFVPFAVQTYFYGVGARFDGTNTVPTQGQGFTLRGYGYGYEPDNQEMVLYLFTGSGNRDVRSQRIFLDDTKDYRFELEVIGSSLHGRVCEVGTPCTPEVGLVAEQFRDFDAEPINVNHDGDPSTPEIPHEIYTQGFSTIFGVNTIFDGDLTYTIDNFRTETAVAGDYSRNGEVDAADYVLWRETLGQAGPLEQAPTSFADMRANGAVSAGAFSQVIDQADYDFWQANFGKAVASGSGIAAVPEPVSNVLLLLGAVCLPFGGRNFGRSA
jgi:hypothetical protein